MIRIEPAKPSDFERVYPLFLAGFNSDPCQKERWRALFHYSWPCTDDTRGFLLMDDEKVVGFFGVILYERTIGGEIEKFGNLTSWITLPEYRNHSLLLFKAAVSILGRTLTCITPRPEVLPLYLRFGFRELENSSRILYPIPAFSTPSAWFRYRATTNPDKIRQRLDENDRALFEHHRPHPCGNLLIYNRDEYCHVIFTRIKGRRFGFAYIHHISNFPVFAKNLDRVRFRVALAAGVPFVMVDTRYLQGMIPKFSRAVTIGHMPIYKSDRLKPEQIDTLYSEAILLNL